MRSEPNSISMIRSRLIPILPASIARPGLRRPRQALQNRHQIHYSARAAPARGEVCMKTERRRFLLLMLAAAIALAGQSARAAAQELTRAAFNDLKQGGFVVVIRHGKTNAVAGMSEDKSPLDLASCADQA